MKFRDTKSENTVERWKLQLTPNEVLITASFVAFTAFLISSWITIHQPWLGISLSDSNHGLIIASVDENGPSASILNSGDIILSIASNDGSYMQLQSQDIIEDADNIPTLKKRNTFSNRQSKLYQILLQPIVNIMLDDGRMMRVQPQSHRPLSSLPISFWALIIYSVIAALVGASIWSFKQNDSSAKYLLLAGFGVVVLLNSANIFISRELALDGNFYLHLIFFYHLGNDIFALGLIGLVWNYPRSIARFPVIPLLSIVMLFFMLNEIVELTELPGNSVLFQIPLYCALGILLVSIQWVKSQNHPVDRAAIKLLSMTLLVIIVIVLVTDFVAVFTSEAPQISLSSSFFALLIFYILLSLVVYRYHLFDIDRWWIEIWLWFFIGIVIVLFDMAFVTIVEMASSYSLIVSVITVGWLYFPLRQWACEKLFHRKRYNLEQWIPLLVSHFISAKNGSDQYLWKKVLNEVFRPLNIESRLQLLEEPELVNNGVCMLTPCLEPKCSLKLFYADKGNRLFNNDDIRLVQSLFNIMREAMTQQRNYNLGKQEERKRIMRDLHDDIGGRLLTLMHAENDQSHAAADALKSLREIIYCLDTDLETTLNTAIAQWRIEALNRCEQAHVAFKWYWQELAVDFGLTPRQHLNLTLIMREGLSNILRHAKTKHAFFELKLEIGELKITMQNDDELGSTNQITPGKGLHNMRTRTEELGGSFNYLSEIGSFYVEISIPMNEEVEGLVDA